MSMNLMAELLKKGIRQSNAIKLIAKVIGVSEKTVRNKINGITEWKLSEAVAINDKFFDGKQSIEYLFSKIDTTRSFELNGEKAGTAQKGGKQ